MRILIIGLGALGERYLEGFRQYEKSTGISVQVEYIDPMRSLVYDCQSTSWDMAVKVRYDLCVVSTNAVVRDRLYSDLLKIKAKYIVLEKNISSSLLPLPEIRSLSDRDHVYVNFPLRNYPQYALAPRPLSHLTVEVTGQHWGLTCNAMHFLELYCYLTGSYSNFLLVAELDERFDSKRPGINEYFGRVEMTSARGCIKLSSSKGHGDRTVALQAPEYRFLSQGSQTLEFTVEGISLSAPVTEIFQTTLSRDMLRDVEAGTVLNLPSLWQVLPLHVKYLEALGAVLQRSETELRIA